MKNLQTRIEKLLKALVAENKLNTVALDSDSQESIELRMQNRKKLLDSPIITDFEKINNCYVKAGPFSLIITNDDFYYLGYIRNGAICVERKQDR